MKNDLFCTKCFNDEEFKKADGTVTHEIKNEKFEESVEKLICQKCGEEIIEDEVFDRSLLNAFNTYRKKHNLLLPEEIENILETYDLSQRALSRLLGWGEVTINRYLNGSLQDKAHDQMLSFITQPDNMLELLEKNKGNVSDKVHKKTKEKAEELLLKNSLTDNIIIKKLQTLPNIYRGNKKFDIDKFYNIILFYSQNIQKLWKTKLLKLIFYAEFLNFKQNKTSIAGTSFIHWEHGPVPKRIYALLDILIEDYNVIELQDVSEFYNGSIVINKKEFNSSLFCKEELETLNFILNKFKDYTSNDLCQLTHKETAYIETKHNEFISYDFAKEINI